MFYRFLWTCGKFRKNQTITVGGLMIWKKFDDTNPHGHINHLYYKLCWL